MTTPGPLRGTAIVAGAGTVAGAALLALALALRPRLARDGAVVAWFVALGVALASGNTLLGRTPLAAVPLALAVAGLVATRRDTARAWRAAA